MKRSRRREALKILATVAVTGLLLEGAIRALNLVRPLSFLHTTSYNRFRAAPHAPDFGSRLNAGGFKDLEFGAKRAGTYRIVALGDSFAFGIVPYEANYLTLLERGLQEQGLDVEVLNMGIPSIGPVAYLDLLRDEALPLEPDMVLLSFFIGNDFYETKRRRKYYTYSAVLMSARYVYFRLTRYEGRIPSGAGEYCDDCPTFNEEAYLEIEKKRSTVFVLDDPDFDQMSAAATDYLTTIRDVCRERDIPLLVAMLPDEMQVNEDLRRTVMAMQPVARADGWDTRRPNRVLAERLDEAQIRFLDLLPDLQRASQAERVYRPRDTHWNLAGNRVAAAALEPWVRSQIAVQRTETVGDQ